MNRPTALGILLLAATLEAGGDALVRVGLHTAAVWQRTALFFLAALILFAYGLTVNSPSWDFGKLLGLYVVLFFLISQLIAWLVFKQPPSLSILLGGAFILTGGLIISFAKF